MKSATITRQPSTPEGAFGRLTTDDGTLTCHTLELPWVDENGDGIGDKERSCITAGTYRCEWHNSPKFGFCYTVTGVKGRSHILIHSANLAGDTEQGWVSELLGCIAPGRHLDVATTHRGKPIRPQRCVTHSRQALNALHAWANKEPFMLTIRWVQ